jgi:hypothetical protein
MLPPPFVMEARGPINRGKVESGVPAALRGGEWGARKGQA